MVRTLFLALVLLLGAQSSRAVPVSPRELEGITDPGLRHLLTWEPLGENPPQALREAVASRLATGENVTLRMVVVLADFMDRPASGSMLDLAAIEQRLFSVGELPLGSMADYYLENTQGRLLLTGQVIGWYRMPERYSAYVAGSAGLSYFPRNTQGMVRDATRMADADVNYASFDNDGPDGVADTGDDDQRVDLLLVMHSGGGNEGSSSPIELRSVAWFLPDPAYMDGVNVTEFAIAPWSGGLGVTAHETGHLLGLPDLYDATGRSLGLGAWSLMSGGWSLGETNTPAHLDAWCKTRLGVFDPIVVTSLREAEPIDPIETNGPIYKLLIPGAGGYQYFLVENRRRIGFDEFLPGEGLLIYQVNELRPNNNISPSYKVGLEQADGLFQLENLNGNPSFGDEGDPWTASTPQEGFGRFTTPDSRNHEGQDTGVAVYGISGPDLTGRMKATLRPSQGPVAQLQSIDVTPLTGDGDRFLEPDETFALTPSVLVSGGTVTDLVLSGTSSDAHLVLETASQPIGALSTGTHALPPLVARVTGVLPTNPYGLPVNLRVGYREEVPAHAVITIAAGDVEGMMADFSDGNDGFTNKVLRIDRLNVWRYETSAPNTGSRAWHAGNPGGGYPAATDCVLESSLFLIPPAGRLRFDHLVEIAHDESMMVAAGGFVQLSVNGGSWESITPVGGYDTTFFSRDLDLNNRGIFVGQRPEWAPVEFDLSSFHGSARLRFRFFSMTSRIGDRGWWIDNVLIESSDVPVRLLELAAVREEADVTLSWRLDPSDLPSALVVHRDLPGQAASASGLVVLPGSAAGTWRDIGAPAGDLIYRLDAISRTGVTIPLGQATVTAAPPPPLALRVTPNPCRASARIAFVSGAPGHVTLRLYDSAGRMVRTLLDETLPPGEHRIDWDVRDDRGLPVPAGLYFAKATAPSGSVTQRLVVVP